MEINITYDSSVNSAPAGFEAGVTAAVQYLESEFTNPVTINIDVGYGEVHGQSLGSDALGESSASYVSESYSAVRSALLAEGAPGASTLPVNSPDQGTLEMSTAEAKALGLMSSNASIDGYVGFSSQANIFSYANGSVPPSSEYYFIGVVEHEITEDMGRVSLLDGQPSYYSAMDLFRYSSPGVRDLTTGGAGSTAYFSIDNGTTNLGSWNNDPENGDLGDWYGNNIPNGGDDAFNDYSNPGVIDSVSGSDVTLMNALGWETGPTVNVAANVLVAENNSVAGSSLISSISNPEGNSITQYIFIDEGGGTGYFTYNGIRQPDGQWIFTNNLAAIQYVGGSTPGGDTVQAGIFDATTNSYYYSSPITITTTAPVTVANNFFGTGTSGLAWQNPYAGPGYVEIWDLTGATIDADSGIVTLNGAAYPVTPDWNYLGNGYHDLIWRNNDAGGIVAIWQMNGTQIIPNSSGYATLDGALYAATPDWNYLGVGDFFDNGDSDILWQNRYAGGVVSIWEMNGTQIDPHNSGYVTLNGTIYAPTPDWNFLGTGDLFGDGDNDILWQNHDVGGVVSIWNMNGTQIEPGSSGYATLNGAVYALTPDWQYLATGDFFGGSTDGILWQNKYTDTVSIWDMHGTQIDPNASGYVTIGGSAAAAAAAVQGYQFLEAGNFYGNGYTDIAWLNNSTGDVLIWEMQGLQVVNSVVAKLNGTAVSGTAGGWHPLT